MLTPTEGIYPGSTGYRFTDPTGTGLEGRNLADLIARVRAWRAMNGLPAGNPEAEVHEFLCRRNPGLCKGGEPAKPKPPGTRLLAERVLAWLGRIGSGLRKPVRVPDGLIASRAAVCRQCSYNKEYAAACTGCAAGSLAVRNAWVSGTAATITAGAFGCAQYGYDAAVAVQLPLEHMPRDAHAPSGCWRADR